MQRPDLCFVKRQMVGRYERRMIAQLVQGPAVIDRTERDAAVVLEHGDVRPSNGRSKVPVAGSAIDLLGAKNPERRMARLNHDDISDLLEQPVQIGQPLEVASRGQPRRLRITTVRGEPHVVVSAAVGDFREPLTEIALRQFAYGRCSSAERCRNA